jgi:hypothetical protein
MRLLSIFSMALVSIILITSQSPAAFAGIGDDHDADGDNYSPNEGDCDDTDPEIYPGHGDCKYPVKEDTEQIEDEINYLVESGAFDITSGQAENLLYKLQHAVEKTDDDKINVAIKMLESFINTINAYINSGAISQTNGDGLIAGVLGIIDYLENN